MYKVIVLKLFRMIKTTYKQFLALALITAVGVAISYAATTAHENLKASNDEYHKKYGFADYDYKIAGAPYKIVEELKKIHGVDKVSGRLQEDIKIVSKENQITARVNTFLLPMDSNINKHYLEKGRLAKDSEQGDTVEIEVEASFAKANKFSLGEKLEGYIDGKKFNLLIVGIATSPEFEKALRSPISYYEGGSFGIVMMTYKSFNRISSKNDMVNNILLSLNPREKSNSSALAQVEKVLAPYGVIGKQSSTNHSSEINTTVQIDGLGKAAGFLPVVFFIVVLAFVFILITQLIKSQRLQIGIMKAIGFDNKTIMLQFLLFSIFITLIGSICGIIIGTIITNSITKVYLATLNIPIEVVKFNFSTAFFQIITSVLTGIFAGLLATLMIIKINPVEAMKSKAPVIGKKIFVENFKFLWKSLSASWKMSLRSISRNSLKFFVTSLGIAATVLLLIIGMFFNDSTQYMMSRFFDQDNLYTSTINYNTFVQKDSLSKISSLKGVQKAEPMLQMPVNIISTKNDKKHATDVVMGIETNSSLKKVYTPENASVEVPINGIVINKAIADKLDLSKGDMVKIEAIIGKDRIISNHIKIADVNLTFMGGVSYASLEQVNDFIKTKNLMNAVLQKSEKIHKAEIENTLLKDKNINVVLYKDNQKLCAKDGLKNMKIFTAIMVVAAILIGFTIIYIISVMNFNDRQREVASLRVIGFTRKEISSFLFNELLLALIIGLAVGFPAGIYVGHKYINVIGSENFIYPAYIKLTNCALIGVITIAFTMCGHVLAMKRLKLLDLVEVLKERD